MATTTAERTAQAPPDLADLEWTEITIYHADLPEPTVRIALRAGHEAEDIDDIISDYRLEAQYHYDRGNRPRALPYSYIADALELHR